jgi:hypothetical protein
MRDGTVLVVLAIGVLQAFCAKAIAGPAGAPAAYQASTVQVTKLTHRTKLLSPASLCMNAGSDRECEQAFTAALRSAQEPADVVVTASATGAFVGPRGAEPLRFQKRAPWVRRLETIGKEGIPFVRVPRGPDSELVVGINRKGMLGFSLRQTSTR